MQWKHLIVAGLLSIAFTAGAQRKLIVAGDPGSFYVTHVVAEKENLYSIGRIYQISPRQISALNRIGLNDILPIGYKLRVPLNLKNLVTESADGNNEPVYHIAGKGDNLFKLSQRYNKVKTSSLRDWNDLRTDLVKNGQAIIIGFLPVNRAEATTANPTGKEVFVKPPVVTKPEDPSQKSLDHPNVLDAKKDGSREVKGEMKPLTDEQILELRQAEATAKRQAEEAQNKMPPVVPGPLPKEAPKEIAVPEEEVRYSPKANDEGYFALLYPANGGAGNLKTLNGQAGTFKTSSGLTDRKFYVLMNDVLPGTIVRMTVAGKSVCARVLGSLPYMKNAPNLLLRMSTATANALGLKEGSPVSVSLTYTE